MNALKRHKKGGSNQSVALDYLSYTYNTGNQLLKVEEQIDGASGFEDGNNGSANDYTYDVNGNMVKDLNKGIVGASSTNGILYNHLNLPEEVKFGSTNKIKYIYDATGVKLSKRVVESGNPDKYTYYAGNYVYEDSSLKFFNHPEGYVEPVNPANYGSGFNYVYQYKDHLGNIRLSYKDPNGNYRQMLDSDFTNDMDGWVHNGSVTSSFENGRLKLNVNSSWEGVKHYLDNFNVSPGETYNVKLVFDKGNTQAKIRLYFQELDANGNHLSWNSKNSNLTTGSYEYSHTVIAGNKLILRIDKDNTYTGNSTYFYIDHVSLTRNSLQIQEENNYYPFGLEHKGYNNNPTSSNIALKKKFAGEEFEDELGKNTVAFQWRDYDPAIARFNKIDRYAEKYLDISPYGYTANNPIRFREIKGDSLNITSMNPDGSGIEEFQQTVSSNLGYLYNTEVDENGNVTVTRNNAEGTLTDKQETFLKVLNKVIGNGGTTSFKVLEAGSLFSEEVPVADNGGRDGTVPGTGISFEPGTHVLDLGDINKFPNIGSGKSSSAGVLSHELEEGFQMQVGGRSANRAHNAGIGMQGVVDGYRFGSATFNSTGTQLEIPVSTVGGTAQPSIKANVNKNNITTITNN